VYGPRQNPHGEAGVVAIFLLRLLHGEEPIINGDGLQTRDYIHVQDVVRAVLAALDSSVSGHFNVGTGRQATVNEIFHMIAGHLGADAEERHGPARDGEQRTSALDSTLIGEKLGWRAQVDLEDGLAQTADWFRQSVLSTR
jgi:UDP-glucose 4-epimerase